MGDALDCQLADECEWLGGMGVGMGIQDKDDQKGSMVGRNIVVVSEEGTQFRIKSMNNVGDDEYEDVYDAYFVINVG